MTFHTQIKKWSNHFNLNINIPPISKANDIFAASVAKYGLFLQNLANDIVCSHNHFRPNKICLVSVARRK